MDQIVTSSVMGGGVGGGSTNTGASFSNLTQSQLQQSSKASQSKIKNKECTMYGLLLDHQLLNPSSGGISQSTTAENYTNKVGTLREKLDKLFTFINFL